MVIEGQPTDMTVYCLATGTCNHSKVTWYTNRGYEIPFRLTDPHFRRESFDNLHRLWIDKVHLTDDGIFTVKKTSDTKQCELQVIGKKKNQ